MDDSLLGVELEDDEATAVMQDPNDSAEGQEADPTTEPGALAEPAAGTDAADTEAVDTDAADSEAAQDEVEAAERERGPGPGADLSDDQLEERALALLFASPDPLSIGRLVNLLERPPAARVRAAVEAIGHRLQSAGLPLQLRGIRGGYMLMTVPEMGEVVSRLAKGPAVERISPAALETLSIVAYRQPVTKAEIEAIRGVQAGPILRSLVDRGLARVTGRADVPGHPLQYGTTKDFLDRFGLMGLDDLPRDAELARD